MGKWLILGVVLLLVVATCVPGGGDEDEGLFYAGPVEIGIGRGEFLPGTDIQYLGKTQDGAQVLIGGQQALKKMGDSLNWTGSPLEAVAADLNLRVALITEEKLHAAGTAEIAVADPTPRSGAVNDEAPIHYKVPVGYHVEKGTAIPGSTITYLGKTDKGAHLGNIEGYAYREPGDSIVWKGQLRDRVWLELDVRTALITDDALNVAGTADLWIAP